jgi:hypothetical protein
MSSPLTGGWAKGRLKKWPKVHSPSEANRPLSQHDLSKEEGFQSSILYWA